MSRETPAQNQITGNSENSPAPEPAPEKKSPRHDASVRTAMVAGWFGIAGTLLTCIVTWALNHVDKTSRPPVPTSIAAPAHAPGAPTAANVSAVVPNSTPGTPPQPSRHEELLRQSPITFADWQALVHDRLNVEQRRTVFGGEVGKRVTWQGVFDQYNLIQYGTVTSDNAYIVLMFENETARHAAPLRPAPALCHFPALAKRKLAELRPGQRVVISGTLSNPELAGQLLGTELQACELVAVLDH